MRAILHGGPVEGKVIDDVGEDCYNIQIPANFTPRYAHYRRVGQSKFYDTAGPYLRFDFVAVYEGTPLADRLLEEI
jgi:hypothetical protein